MRGDNPVAAKWSMLNNAKLYVPVVTLSINDNINFSKNIKQEVTRTISWNIDI